MLKETLAKVYAESLFNLAHAAKTERDCLDELHHFNRFLRHEVIADFLTSPVVPLERKREICTEIFGLTTFSEPLRNIVALLLERKKLGLLPDIEIHFTRFLERQEGILQVEVHSGFPVGENELASIAGKLHQLSGATIRLHPRVDETLLGGLKLVIGDTVIDGTIKGYLTTLRETVRRA